MTFDYPSEQPESLGDQAQVHRIVRQVVMSYRELDGHDVDERIDRKIDKVKLWLFGVVVANLIPVVAFAYMFGQFTGQIETKLNSMSGMSGVEVERRFDEVDRRVTALESYHRGGVR